MSQPAASITPEPAKYRLLKKIAQGGMAEIFLAEATGIERFRKNVVVKRIIPEHAGNESFVRMFLDEARLAAQLHHQNIAQVFDIGRSDGGYFFSMEYLHGRDARQIAQEVADNEESIPLQHALTIVAGCAAGLHYAHKKANSTGQPLNIVHRDISPSNIFVTFDGAVKLVDFGIAKAADRTTKTKTGSLKGKYPYMSPEQATSAELDQRSDIFSLGIVLYELTTMTRLFRESNDIETLIRVSQADVPRPSTRVADYPLALEAIVMQALALEVEHRYQSAGELLEDLENFAATNQLSLSVSALSRYANDLFGKPPEPWAALADVEGTFLSIETDPISTVSATPPKGDDSVTVAFTNIAQDSTSPIKPKSRRSKIWLVVGALVIWVLAAAWIWREQNSDESTVAATIKPAPKAEGIALDNVVMPAPSIDSAAKKAVIPAPSIAKVAITIDGPPNNTEVFIRSETGLALIGRAPGTLSIPLSDIPLQLTFRLNTRTTTQTLTPNKDQTLTVRLPRTKRTKKPPKHERTTGPRDPHAIEKPWGN